MGTLLLNNSKAHICFFHFYEKRIDKIVFMKSILTKLFL